MKISGNFFRDTINQVTARQNKTIKEDHNELVQKDKVSISSAENNKVEDVKAYSPENLRTERVSEETRTERIARIKEAVENNAYKVASEKVAEKMIGTHINDII